MVCPLLFVGSTGFVTDQNGELYEHIEYFPFGETWVQEKSNTQRMPYLYTGKELDEETGLYYYGARYYDPRTSVWASADPILGEYLPKPPKKPEEAVKLQPPSVEQPFAGFNLPGMGGVFNPKNIGLYSYSYQNPVNLKDPDGRHPILILLAFGLMANEVATSDVPMVGGSLGKATITAGERIAANRIRGITAEAKIAARFPKAGTQVAKETKQGTRYIDVLTPQGVAIESKVGKTSLTKDVKLQIAKDVELMKNPASGVKSVEWRFSRSDATGQIGPTAPLREALDRAGIKVILE